MALGISEEWNCAIARTYTIHILILHLKKATKRNRIQASEGSTNTKTGGGPPSSSEDSENTRAKKIPNLESSVDSDNPEDTETDGDDCTVEKQKRKRKFTKKKPLEQV